MSQHTASAGGGGALARPAPVGGGVSNALRSPILWLIFRRIGGAVLVLFGATLLTFVLMNVISGGAAQQILGPDATAEQIAQLEAKLGLDQPPLNRYLGWLGGTLTGNFGTSLTSGQPVSAIIASRAPVSFELVLLAFLLGVICAFPVALMAARKPGGVADRIGMAVSVSGLSIAGYVVALVLVLVFAVNLRLFPAIGYIPISKGLGPNLWSLALPAIAMALPGFAFYARFLRGDLIEQMQQDYALVAKSKGLPPGRVLVFHALRNSLTGLLTVVALNLGALIGSTVIMEQIFGLPGIGKLLLEGIVNRDIAVVQACVLIFAAIVVVANLAVDILYAVIDPRIRHGRD